ncbi:MAG: BrnT family toxin, partial [Polyangiaceae bacterium]
MLLLVPVTRKMIVYNNFEWDVRCAAASLAAQGVSFKEASTVFESGDVRVVTDPASGEHCAVGLSARGRMLAVHHVHVPGPRIRILSVALHKPGTSPYSGKPAVSGANGKSAGVKSPARPAVDTQPRDGKSVPAGLSPAMNGAASSGVAGPASGRAPAVNGSASN